MANRPAPALLLRDGDREELLRLTRSSRAPAGLALRARIVLLAADGVSNTTIADGVGVSRPTVIKWRDRFLAHGLAGLDDQARSGRPKTIDDAQIIAVTLLLGAMGAAVFSGMIGVTVFGLMLTPVFYVLLRREQTKVAPAIGPEVVSHA